MITTGRSKYVEGPNEYYEIDFSDLNILLQEAFPDNKNLSCIPEGSPNSTYLKLDIWSADIPYTEWEGEGKEVMENFLKYRRVGSRWNLELVLSELCRLGMLPEGQYLLSIFW